MMPGLLRRLAACRRDLTGLVEGVAGRDRRLQAHPLEATVLESRIRLGRNPVLIAAFMSVVTDEDRWGKRWMT